jgi:hypothetical protein
MFIKDFAYYLVHITNGRRLSWRNLSWVDFQHVEAKAVWQAYERPHQKVS